MYTKEILLCRVPSCQNYTMVGIINCIYLFSIYWHLLRLLIDTADFLTYTWQLLVCYNETYKSICHFDNCAQVDLWVYHPIVHKHFQTLWMFQWHYCLYASWVSMIAKLHSVYEHIHNCIVYWCPIMASFISVCEYPKLHSLSMFHTGTVYQCSGISVIAQFINSP